MIRTKLVNQNGFFNTNKLKRANEAFEKAIASKPRITIIQAVAYPTFVQVYYLQDLSQNDVRISLLNFEIFVCEYFEVLPKTNEIDINLSEYIDTNLNAICAAYLASGKEISK